MEELNNSLDEVIDYIKNTKEYKMCITLKEQMSDNDNLNSIINKIKRLQKQYIRTNDFKIKDELTLLENELKEIPIYNIYNQNLNKVNEMINYVKDRLNSYFDQLLNNKKN